MKYKLTGRDKATGATLLSSFNQIIDSKWTQVFDVLFVTPAQDFEQVNPQDFLRSDEIVADMMRYMRSTRWINWDYKQDEGKEKIRWKEATKEAIFKQFQNYCDEYRKRIQMPLFKWKKNKTAEPVVDALIPPPPPPVVEHAVVDDDIVIENNPMDDSLLQLMRDAEYDVMNTSLIMDNPLPQANVMDDFAFLDTHHAEVSETREQELQRRIESLEEDKAIMNDSIHALQSRLDEAKESKITLENQLREVNEINSTLEERLRVNRQMMDERDKEMRQALNSKEEALRAKDAEVAVLVGERDRLIREYEEKLAMMTRMYDDRLAKMERDMENKKMELREKMLELFDDNLNENNKRGRLNSMDEEEPKRRRMSVDIYEQETVIGEEEPEAESVIEREVEAVIEREVEAVIERENEADVEREVETVVEREVVEREVDAVVEREVDAVVEREVETVIEAENETVFEREVETVVEREVETVFEREVETVFEREVETVIETEAQLWTTRNLAIYEDIKNTKSCYLRKVKGILTAKGTTQHFLSTVISFMKKKYPCLDPQGEAERNIQFLYELQHKYRSWFNNDY